MVIHGEIQRAELNSFKGKDGTLRENIRVIVMDKSKLSRCMTPFQAEVPVADKVKVFGTKKLHQLADEKCTLTVTELIPQNALMRIRGSLYMGHQTADALQKLAESEEAA